MAYLTINSDGSTTQLGAIIGYRVIYTEHGRRKQTKPFNLLWQATGFQKGLRMGQGSRIVPVYARGEKSA
jgi:hypothetical protein